MSTLASRNFNSDSSHYKPPTEEYHIKDNENTENKNQESNNKRPLPYAQKKTPGKYRRGGLNKNKRIKSS